MSDAFSHIDDNGKAQMVDVNPKEPTARCATARGSVRSQLNMVGFVSAADLVDAQVAGEQAAKRVSQLIPLCHQIPLADVFVTVRMFGSRIDIEAEVNAHWKTGVEMEALAAVTVAALTLFYVIETRDPEAVIEDIAVSSKEGGKSGDWASTKNPSPESE